MPNTQSPRIRRSRQVRGARRRNFTRAVARGRSRDEALDEFHARGGRLTEDEQQRLIYISEARLRERTGARMLGETKRLLDTNSKMRDLLQPKATRDELDEGPQL